MRDKYYGMGVLVVGVILAATAYVIFPEPKIKEIPDNWGKLTVSRVVYSNQVSEIQPNVNVEIVEGCRIPRFGTHPWALPGSTRTEEWASATYTFLRHAGWTDSESKEGVERLRSGKPDDTFVMTNLGGTATTSGQRFKPVFETGYKKDGKWYKCVDSRTNFSTNSQEEDAKLFWINGKPLVEFRRCGNVTTISPGEHEVTGFGYIPRIEENTGVNSVPEPGTLVLLVTALGGMYFIRKKK